MVVTELSDHVLLFDQHGHGKVCGEFATVWREEYFIGSKRRNSVEFAVFEHDNGWIELDSHPLLNCQTGLPYSFIDYPLETKLKAYRTCIERVEKQDSYAALLCSLHYTSFFEKYTNGRGRDFLSRERERQGRLRKEMLISIDDEKEMNFHYQLLQFCDNLSLYLCMNQPGVDKENEFLWFKRGFTQKFSFNHYQTIVAFWKDEKTVVLNHFPFKKEITVALNYRSIAKRDLQNLDTAFKQEKVKQRVVKIAKA